MVLVVCQSADHVGPNLSCLPHELAAGFAEIVVLDDTPGGGAVGAAEQAAKTLALPNLRAYRTPSRRGSGGCQKIAFTYAIEQGWDYVVVLPGDSNCPAELLSDLAAGLAQTGADVVLGSRMLRPADALKSGMRWHRWLGNRLVTRLQNLMLGVKLSEYHTRYRVYRVEPLRHMPFHHASDDGHFDTQMLIYFVSAGLVIAEVSLSCPPKTAVRPAGLRYAWNCLKAAAKYRLFTMGLLYNRLLDFHLFETENYFFKKARNSLHQYVVRWGYRPDERVLDLGAAGGYISAEIARRVREVVAVDARPPRRAGAATCLALDLNGEFDKVLGRSRFDTVLALDVIEHLDQPELAAQRIARVLKPGGRVLASTANIAYLPMRLMLLCGVFNYGKRGILDATHKRLFTIWTFKDLFKTYGFRIEKVRGFGPPIRDLISSRGAFALLDSLLGWLARWLPRLFAYNFLLVARRLPLLEEVYAETITSRHGVGT